MTGSKDGSSAKFTHSKRQFSHTGRQFSHSAREFSKTSSSKSSDKLPSLDEVFHAESSKGAALDRFARRQLLLTVAGAGLLVASFALAGAAGWFTMASTQEATGEVGLEIRRRTAESVQASVAEILRPAYVAAGQLREEARSGRAGSEVWEPTRENFEHHHNQLLSRMWTQLNPEVHTTKVSTDGSEKEYVPFIGLGFQVAMQADLETPATSMAECAQFLLLSIFRIRIGASLGTSVVYPTFAAGPPSGGAATASGGSAESPAAGAAAGDGTEGSVGGVARSAAGGGATAPTGAVGGGATTPDFELVSPGPTGPVVIGGAVLHRSFIYDSDLYRAAPMPGKPVPVSCQGMVRVWGDRDERKNISGIFWHGPSTDGRQAFSAISPVYSGGAGAGGAGGRAVGFISAGISLLGSIYPTLRKTVEAAAGGMLAGAEIALVTASGLVLGATELSDTQGDETLADLPEGGLLSRAASAVTAAAGGPCPEEHVRVEEDDRLVDAIPFEAESYGMPPLPERWCVVLTIPRENIYQAIDHSRSTANIAAFIILGMFVLSIALLVISFCLAVWSHRGLRDDKLKGDLRQVIRSVKEVNALNCPMAVVSAKVFLQLTRLEYFEALRDDGLVTVLDSLEAIARFKEENMILFFSHQWLSFNFPDTEGSVQLAAMQGAIRTLMSNPETTKNIYVWCDFISIAQRHQKMQHAAIASLPVYARVADKFIIVAPPAVHADLECECNLETYNRRGWCRTEMLAKACGSGIEEMYTCTDKEGTLRAVTVEDLRNLSFSVMDGDFAVREDIEDLVGPILGLYSLVLRESHLPHMQVLHEHIEQDKGRFFPRSYQKERSGESVELFGSQVELLEKYVAKGFEACASRVLSGGRPSTPSTATPRSATPTTPTSAPVSPTRLGASASPTHAFGGTASEQLLLP